MNKATFEYPKQASYLGKRVRVMFRYEEPFFPGVIVRDDSEPPMETIIKLDNGRYVRAVECQYQIESESN